MGEKQKGMLESILYMGVFPLVFTAVFAVVILKLLNIPVGETFMDIGKEIPVVSGIIPLPEPVRAEKPDPKDWEQQYLASLAQVSERDQEITELNQQLLSSQAEFEELQKQKEELEQQLVNILAEEEQERNDRAAGIYENIPDSRAAAMFEAMPLEEAAVTISQLEPKKQSRILGKIKNAEKAAQLSLLMKEIAALPETNPESLKAHVQQFVENKENPTDLISETIAGMPPAQSALMISSMMSANSETAMELMKKISSSSRSQILAEIAKEDAKLAAQIAEHLNKQD